MQGIRSEKKKRRRGKKEGATAAAAAGGGGEEDGTDESASAPEPTEIIKEIVAEDGTVMTIREAIPVARTQSPSDEEEEDDDEDDDEEGAAASMVEPCARSNAMAVVKGGRLFLYGGMFEVCLFLCLLVFVF